MVVAVNEYGGTNAVGLVNALGSLAAILVGLAATLWIDKFNQRSMLLALDATTAVATFVAMGILVLAPASNVTALAATIAVVTAAAASLYSPASRSVVPSLMPKDALERYNSFYTSFTEMSRAAGPLLGTVLLAVGGSEAFVLSLLVNGVSFSLSFAFTLKLPRGQKLHTAQKHGGRLSAFRHIIGQPQVLSDVAGAAGINFFLTSLAFVLLTRISETDSSNVVYGLASTVQAIGVVLAAVVAGRITRFLRPLRAPGLLVPMALSLLIGLLAGPWAVVAALTAVAILETFYNIVLFSRLQRETPGEVIGRVFAVVTTSAIALIPLGNLLFGRLAASFSSSTLLLITSVGLVVLRLLAMVLARTGAKGISGEMVS